VPRLRQVIESEVLRGSGNSPDDPIRRVVQFHDPDGTFLAENDPCPAPQPQRSDWAEARGVQRV